jgi:5-methylcytosine-specific restriction endonuclease McrA
MFLNERVLVLNASYEPINICGVRRAVAMVFKGIAHLEETDRARALRSPSRTFPLPVVVRLLHYVCTPYRNFTFSKKNVFIRDRYTCQYCGSTHAARELTLDHVVPRSRGGTADWENLATCCKACNLRKGDRTPQEADMKLIKRPRATRHHSFLHYLHVKGSTEEQWRKYLFYEYKESEWMWQDSPAAS